MGKYPERPLSEICTMLTGGTPAKSDSTLWRGDIPWVSPKDMDAWLLDDAEDHVARTALGKGTRLAPKGATLIVVRSMTLGNRVQIGYLRRDMAFNQDLKAIVPGAEVDGRFLFYAFAAARPIIKGLVDEASHGTKRLQTELLSQLRIPVPGLSDQRTITHILGALDDKIELNSRTNETVHALGTAYVDQALLDDPIDVMIGDAFFVNPEQVGPGGLPDPLHYIDIGSVNRGTLNARITLAAAAAPSRARRLVRQGDTIISTVRPGRRAFLFIDQPDSRLVVSTGFAVLRPKLLPPGVSYFAATRPSSIQNLDLNATGAAYPAVPASVLEGLGVLMPAEPLVKKLEQFLNPVLKLFHANLRQNETLARIRDILLPKLMSGEIQFKEAEKAVAEAL